MTQTETISLLALIKTAYPNFGGDSDPGDVAALWCDMLADLPRKRVEAALWRYIQSSRFPPAIADIRTQCAEKELPGEVWQEARRLMNSGIAPDDERTAYARMSPACKAAVMAVGGWYALSVSDENDPHIRQAFLRAAEKAEASAALPPGRLRIGGGT